VAGKPLKPSRDQIEYLIERVEAVACESPQS
jgi:hypothetical protein